MNWTPSCTSLSTFEPDFEDVWLSGALRACRIMMNYEWMQQESRAGFSRPESYPSLVAHSDSHLVSNHERFEDLVTRHPTAHQMVSNGFCYSFQSEGERQQLSFVWVFDQARLSPGFAKDDVLRLQIVQNVLAQRSCLLYDCLWNHMRSTKALQCVGMGMAQNSHTHYAHAKGVNDHERIEENIVMHHEKIEACKIWQAEPGTPNWLVATICSSVSVKSAGKPGNWPAISLYRAPRGKKRRYRVLPDAPPCWLRDAEAKGIKRPIENVGAKGSNPFSNMAPKCPKEKHRCAQVPCPTLSHTAQPCQCHDKRERTKTEPWGLRASLCHPFLLRRAGSRPPHRFLLFHSPSLPPAETVVNTELQWCMRTRQSGAIEHLS